LSGHTDTHAGPIALPVIEKSLPHIFSAAYNQITELWISQYSDHMD